ncbi:MAG TPA: ABC transporter permease [Bryobacteraceae bacterium]|nr:ABC transporter permease [Bryobacteraceae bacterium]
MIGWVRSLIRNLFLRERVESELDLEVRSYADLLEEENMSKGMSPEEARRVVRIEIGGPDQIKEEVRGARAGAWIETVWQDLRSGARMLRRNRGFAATAILTLALGIGANTAIFSVVRAVLLSSLPYRQPDKLVKIWGQYAAEGLLKNSLSDPELFELEDTNQSFEQVAAYYPSGGANLGSDETEPQRITRGSATWTLFPLLGVQPILGRTFSAEEDKPGHNVSVISYGLWRSFFAGDPNVVGKTIRMNNRPSTVVGVLPEGFDFAGDNQVWIPLALDRNHPDGRGNHSWNAIGRLKPGVTVAQASADMKRFAQQLAREYPDYYEPSSGWGVIVVPLREELVAQIRPALLILMAATGIVLLIACANIANLLLARSSAREKEMAVRASLGAGQGRIIRQLLTESLLLSVIGCAAGLALGELGMTAIRGLHAEILPRVGKVEFDLTMLWFALAIAVFAGLLFGLAPAIHVSRPLHDAMKEAGREGSGGRRGLRIRNTLVVSEIAFSLLLVTAAGLTIRSFYRLLHVDPGFRTDHILTMRMTLPSLSYPDGPAVPQFFNQLLGRIRALPGVESAAAISQLPMGGYRSSGSVFVENSNVSVLQRTPAVPYGYIETDQVFATPGYFDTMRTPLEAGRAFSDADTAASNGVVIVDTKFASSIWPGQNPLQQRVCMNFKGDPKSPQPQWRTVVGVVAHVHNDSLDVEGRGQAYFPQTQDPFGGSRAMFLTVRTAQDPVSIAKSVRAQVFAMDRSEPLYSVRTMDDVLAASIEQPRLSLDLLGLFASLAFALAAIGVYGVIAFAVSQRKHELGIRMALGAQAWDIRKMVIAQGARLALAGVAIGLAGAFYLSRYMAPLLYGIETRDPVTLAVVPVLLLGVTLAATWIPATRATRVDPIETLRHQ